MRHICKIIFTFFLFIASTLCLYAQTIRWASKVVGFSSEYLTSGQATEYKAIQVLGKPNRMPLVGSGFCTWQPSVPDNPNEEWIKVSFDTLMPIRQVAIAENLGAGCVTQVFAYDPADNEYVIYENLKPAEKGSTGRMLNVILPQSTTYRVSAIKVVIITAKTKGWNQIDAIGISDTEKNIEAYINVSKNVPENLVKENLGSNINSKWHDMAPIISPDGKTLYYTRDKHPENMGMRKDQDVWVSQWVGGVWQPAQNMGEPINNEDNNAISSITVDGRSALLINIYKPDGTLTKGLSVSRKRKNSWTFPKEVKIRNYRNDSNFSEFCLAPSGSVMIMTLQRRDSYGGKDLYVSFILKDSTWTEPKHMGSVVNTAEAESTPFIAADNRTLYFSSSGFSGYGSSDIYLTRRLDDTWTKWSEPENLGPIINTPEWDGYFTIPASGDFAYLCSQEESLGKEDIYRLKLYPEIKPDPVAIVSGHVFNFDDKKPIEAEIVADILTENKEAIKLNYDPAIGEYKLVLPLKQSYGLSAIKKGFLPISENIDLTREKSFREIRRNLYVLPLEPGQRMVLSNVFFEQSRYDLLATSYSELDKIAEAMNEFCSLEIMLEGHTDNQGDLKENLDLSEKRVKEVKRYLVEKGVDTGRVQIKGWGATKPIASNANEEKRKLNRRVEFLVLKK
jgi:outer membrane protein OmpA-like peptidoglycan-associated protein